MLVYTLYSVNIGVINCVTTLTVTHQLWLPNCYRSLSINALHCKSFTGLRLLFAVALQTHRSDMSVMVRQNMNDSMCCFPLWNGLGEKQRGKRFWHNFVSEKVESIPLALAHKSTNVNNSGGVVATHREPIRASLLLSIQAHTSGKITKNVSGIINTVFWIYFCYGNNQNHSPYVFIWGFIIVIL